MDSKYIVIKVGGKELLFTFPKDVMHKWMFEAVQAIRQGVPNNWSRPYHDAVCVSAGFMMDGQCYGVSESLKVSSRPRHDTLLYAMGGQS